MFKKIISNKILKNFIFAAGVAVLMIFVILWWLKYYTNHGEKIETPNFLGLQIDEAKKLAKENNVQLVIDSVFFTRAPKGSIYIQNPIAHSDTTPSWVKPNRKIYLTAVRRDVQLIPMPGIDASEMVVIPRLNGRFKFKKEFIPGHSGRVLRIEHKGKEVKEGDMLPRDSRLIVYIGQEDKKTPVKFDCLLGLTINEANLKLADKGLSLVEVYNNCSTKLDSMNAKIIHQTPECDEDKSINILKGTDIVVILDGAATGGI